MQTWLMLGSFGSALPKGAFQSSHGLGFLLGQGADGLVVLAHGLRSGVRPEFFRNSHWAIPMGSAIEMDVVVAIIVKSPGIYKSWADMNHMSNMVFVIFFPCAVVFSLAVSSVASALYGG